MKRMSRVIIVVFTFGILGGCSHFQKNEEKATSEETVIGSNGDSAITQGIEPESEFYGEKTGGDIGAGAGVLSATPWNDPQSPLSNKVVYFMFDSSEIQQEYHGLIATHAEYLSQHRNLKVVLEGHADERGSREYNIALSEQRAVAVAKMMKLQGVDDSQIRIVSYGEEKPADFGHDKSSWSLNRRVEIIYPN